MFASLSTPSSSLTLTPAPKIETLSLNGDGSLLNSYTVITEDLLSNGGPVNGLNLVRAVLETGGKIACLTRDPDKLASYDNRADNLRQLRNLVGLESLLEIPIFDCIGYHSWARDYLGSFGKSKTDDVYLVGSHNRFNSLKDIQDQNPKCPLGKWGSSFNLTSKHFPFQLLGGEYYLLNDDTIVICENALRYRSSSRSNVDLQEEFSKIGRPNVILIKDFNFSHAPYAHADLCLAQINDTVLVPKLNQKWREIITKFDASCSSVSVIEELESRLDYNFKLLSQKFNVEQIPTFLPITIRERTYCDIAEDYWYPEVTHLFSTLNFYQRFDRDGVHTFVPSLKADKLPGVPYPADLSFTEEYQIEIVSIFKKLGVASLQFIPVTHHLQHGFVRCCTSELPLRIVEKFRESLVGLEFCQS